MYRLKISGNFLLIIRNADLLEQVRHPLYDINYIILDEDSLNPLFRFIGIIDDIKVKLDKIEEYNYNILLKEDGTPWSNINELTTFLDNNLGKRNPQVSGITGNIVDNTDPKTQS